MDRDVPLSDLPPEEKARRAASFGEVASHYDRYRPGPPPAAIDWILPTRVARVVDLGAGTGALTRLLVDRAEEVVAVSTDRIRSSGRGGPGRLDAPPRRLRRRRAGLVVVALDGPDPDP